MHKARRGPKLIVVRSLAELISRLFQNLCKRRKSVWREHEEVGDIENECRSPKGHAIRWVLECMADRREASRFSGEPGSPPRPGFAEHSPLGRTASTKHPENRLATPQPAVCSHLPSHSTRQLVRAPASPPACARNTPNFAFLHTREFQV